jgi:hypothetical protein
MVTGICLLLPQADSRSSSQAGIRFFVFGHILVINYKGRIKGSGLSFSPLSKPRISRIALNSNRPGILSMQIDEICFLHTQISEISEIRG